MIKKFLMALLLLCGILTAGDVINLSDYVKDRADCTEALRTAVAAAVKEQKPLYIPAGRYYLTDTVKINGVTEIYGHGYPQLVMKDKEKDIFFMDWAWRVRISGLCFEGGKDQLALGNPNTDKGMIQVGNCRFKQASGAAIRFLRRSKAETASTFCLVEQCMFEYCTQVLIAVSDQVHFKDSWITTVRENPKNLAVIENHGTLICTNILGVPYVVNDDLRWIDNHGLNLTCRNFRFGGEGGGFTPVVNYAKYRPKLFGPTIVIEDSYLGAIGNSTRSCAVYCEEIPNRIAIRDSHVSGIKPLIINPKIDLKEYLAEAGSGMITFDISNNSGEFVSLQDELQKAVAELSNRKRDFGDKKLTVTEVEKALKEAIAKAPQIKAEPAPGVMKYERKTEGHRQQSEYRSITMKTHTWTTDDNLDGTTDRCSDFLALGDAGESTVILNIMDQNSYPHFVVKDVEVDLDKTPFLSWRLKDTGTPAGHLALKVIDKSTGKMSTLMENYLDTQFQYYAYDLRPALKKDTGKAVVDIKIYLCGTRIKGATGENNYVNLKKGEYFLLEYLRLEKEEK